MMNDFKTWKLEKNILSFERENLIELIGKPYDLSKIYYRKVQMDYHFSFKANFYSCPPKYAGKEVVIREMDNHLYVYYREERIGVHEIETKYKGGYITSASHYLEMKTITQKQSRLAWKEKKREREIRNSYKHEPKPEYRRTGFNSGQVIKLFQEVEKRDLNIYEEIVL